MNDPILTKRDVARKLRISTRTVERRIQPSLRVGGQNRYYMTDVLAQLKGIPATGGTVVEFPTKRGEAA